MGSDVPASHWRTQLVESSPGRVSLDPFADDRDRQVADLQKLVEEQKKRIDDLVATRNTTDAGIAALERDLKTMTEYRDAVILRETESLRAIAADRDTALDLHRKATQTIETLERDLKTMTERWSQCDEERLGLVKTNRIKSDRIEQLERDLVCAKSHRDAGMVASSEIAKELDTLRGAFADRLVQAVRGSATQTDAQRDQMRAEILDRDELLASAYARIEALEAGREVLMDALRTHESCNECRTLRGIIREQVDKINELEAGRKTLTDNLLALETELEGCPHVSPGLRHEFKAALDRIAKLEDERDEHKRKHVLYYEEMVKRGEALTEIINSATAVME